jgi:two-component system, chemotaxis family, chemotaxis protein CheY
MASILIADDSKFMRNIIKDSLKGSGHKVIGEVDNGTDAIEEYKKLRPDVITVDITMHGKDGFSVVSEIYEFDSNARIVIVSALSKKTLSNANRGIENKVREFISKPFDKATLQRAIEKANG